MAAATPRPAPRRLLRNASGAAMVEFALIAPVLFTFMFAIMDFGHTLYTRVQLQGIVQKTARDSAMEGADATELQRLDDRVLLQARPLVNNATITITRRFYRTFAEAAAARAENWTDTNKNGSCDANEPYQDENKNNTWDADGGNAGQGGAKDATLYTVEMKYPHMFPLMGFIGGETGKDVKIVAQTVLKNQPYGDQDNYGAPVVRNCP